MLKADRTPVDLVKAELVFRKVFAQNVKKAAIDSDAEMEEEERDTTAESEGRGNWGCCGGGGDS